jgi:hypothetical protein
MLCLSGTSWDLEENQMVEFLSRARLRSCMADIADYTVMLFVALMTGVSTLRLLGLLP